jgi:hypothetical protein
VDQTKRLQHPVEVGWNVPEPMARVRGSLGIIVNSRRETLS